MEFVYNHARLPKDHELLMNINSAADRLYKKLNDLDIDSLNISEYNKWYLGNHLRNIHGILQKYTYILSWSVASANCPLNEFVFLDYGGGTGILSLLAKEFKIGKVIYNDIYDVSCKDAKVIGDSIGIQADHYVCGEIDDIIGFLISNNISCNAIASYDVIEHIYDVERFLKILPTLSSESLTIVISSRANIFNPIIKNSIIKKQLKAEYKNREKGWGFKERDDLRAYLKIRTEIILKHAPNLSKKEIEQLARVTRGMIEPDIIKSVDKYIKKGHLPQEQSHPTNTCDPYTGNWTEHLMDPYYLKDILSSGGFKVEIFNGYYGRSKNIVKRHIGSLINIAIYAFKKPGIIVAPFITIYGVKPGNE